jgi:hypothetical protein
MHMAHRCLLSESCCKCINAHADSIDELIRPIAVVEIDEPTIYDWFCKGHAGSNVGREDDALGQQAREPGGRQIVSQHTLAQK